MASAGVWPTRYFSAHAHLLDGVIQQTVTNACLDASSMPPVKSDARGYWAPAARRWP